MYNNNTDGIVHEASNWLDIPRLWGFIEVNRNGLEVLDGVYLIKNEYNNRGAMAYGTWNGNEYFGLTEITLNNCTNNNLTVDPVNNKHWYVKTTKMGIYFYNIGKGYFLQERASEKVTCAEAVANNFVMVERTENNNNYISVKSGDYYLSYSCGWAPNSTYGSVRWLTSDEANATLMTFNRVEEDDYAETIAAVNTKIAAIEALDEAIEQAEALLNNITIGNGIGEYSGGGYTEEELIAYLNEARGIINSNTDVATINTWIDFVNGIMASYSLNIPEAGKYYRLKGNSGNYIDASAIYNNANATAGQMSMKSADDCNLNGTIFYLDENSKLLNYYTGTYITATREISNVAVAGNTWTFSASSIVGKYKIKSNDNNWLHDNSGNRADRCDQDLTDHAETHSWIIEEVTSLPVTITAAGYATFYAPVAVELPEGVTAHTVTINTELGTARLSEGFTKIPANTGVILAGAATTHYLTIIDEEVVLEGNNILSGTVAAAYIQDDAYVLANPKDENEVEKGIGLYRTVLTDGAFKNNSHKAYLPSSALTSAAQLSAGFRFSFGDDTTTAVEKVEMRNEKEEIYDLTGRKLEGISGAGIYIIDGKKVLVK